jgi:rSAM/selenodomain-associated transferase 1
MRPQLLVIAKQPRPGRVKTRLCPPCTPEQAAAIAAASLADTLRAVAATPAARRTLVISGEYPPPAGWSLVRQRGVGLGERLAHAFTDTARPGWSTLLVGMDTPQARPSHLLAVAGSLEQADAVLGPAEDGGWWALALRDPSAARVLATVPMSTVDTFALSVRALRGLGLRVATGPWLRDVDTAADAVSVAAQAPDGRFAAAVRHHLPVEASL